MSNITSSIMDRSQYRSNQVKLFLLTIENVIEQVSEGVSIERFRSILERIELLQNKQNRINKAHSMLKQRIMVETMTEVNEMINEEDLDEKFLSLKKLTDEANSSISLTDSQIIPAWRPPGNVHQHIRSHLMAVKLKQRSDLQLYVQEKEESVKNLRSVVQTMRNKADELRDYIDQCNRKVEEHNVRWEKMLKLMRTDQPAK